MNYHLWSRALPILAVLTFGRAAMAADTEPERFSDLNLEQLMDVSVNVTSEKTQSLREAPGIVSVLTSDDIKRAGARDLADVLRLVPGLTLNGEVETTTAISFRGIYANEGKILIRLDGQDWNDLAFSNFSVADRLPVEQIDRIEVIRGPGSVRFGGWAEVAVIDIHTKNQAHYNGMHFASTGGLLASGQESRRDFSVAAAKSIGENSGYSLSLYRGRAAVSDRVYTSLSGVESDLSESSFQPFLFNAGLTSGGFKFRLIRENFITDQTVGVGTPLLPRSSVAFASTSGELSYEGTLSADWSYRASYRYTTQMPWYFKDPSKVGNNVYYDKTFERETSSLVVKKGEHKASFFVLGAEYRTENGRVNTAIEPGNLSLFFPNSANPSETMSQTAYAVFAETIQQTGIGNFSAGVRHESSSDYPSSTVPRFAFTKILDTWHVKALLSWAYRAPTFENYSFNPTVRPETTRTGEIEVGKRLGHDQQVTLAAFDTQISDPIVFSTFLDPSGQQIDGYQNLDQTGARGLELEWNLKRSDLTADLSWTFASSRGINRVSKYDSGDENRTLGVPQHKVIARAAWSLLSDWWFAPTVIWQSATRAWMPTSTGADIGDFDPTTLASVAIRRENLFLKHLDLTVGGANLLNQNRPYHVAYRSSSSDLASYPGPSREIFGRVEYNVDF